MRARLAGLPPPGDNGPQRERDAALHAGRRHVRLQRRALRFPPAQDRARRHGLPLQIRLRLRDTPAHVPRVRHGHVRHAGRRVRLHHLRLAQKELRRRARPAGDTPAILRRAHRRRHGLRERAEEPRRVLPGDTPLPAGALLGWGVPPLRRSHFGQRIQRRRRGGGGGAYPRAAYTGGRQAPRLRRAARLPALGRAGLQPGLLDSCQAAAKADTHLRHRHGHGPHRPQIRAPLRRVPGQRAHGGHHDARGRPSRARPACLPAGHLRHHDHTREPRHVPRLQIHTRAHGRARPAHGRDIRRALRL